MRKRACVAAVAGVAQAARAARAGAAPVPPPPKSAAALSTTVPPAAQDPSGASTAGQRQQQQQQQQQQQSDDQNLPPGTAWLRSLVDHERQGVPDGAGVASKEGGGGGDNGGGNGGNGGNGSNGPGFDLGPVRRLLTAMGDPQAGPAGGGYRVAHVAGTKGKGSVAAMLSCVLRAAGLRVGTYTSPHLLNASERTVIGGGGGGGAGAGDAAAGAGSGQMPPPRPMSAEEAERLAQAARAASLGLSASDRARLSHFEVSTAMALRWFADERADAAVVECGVGGETDATNVFPPGALAAAVLTPVGHDHLAALGGSVAAAARAKAGIFKRGRPAVVAEQPDPEARRALEEAVARSGAGPVVFLGGRPAGDGGGNGGAAAPPAALVRVVAAGPVELLPPPPFVETQQQQQQQQQQRPKFKHLASQPVRVVLSPGDDSAAAAALGGAPGPLALLRELEASTRASPLRMRLVGRHQRANAAAAIAAAALMAGDDHHEGGDAAAAATASNPLCARLGAEAVARGLSAAFLPGRFQVLGLPPAGPEAASPAAGDRRRYLILDCAHTPESAAALARTARAALASAAASAASGRGGGGGRKSASATAASDADAPPVVLVLAMADDKPHRDVAAQLLYHLRPRAVVFTSVPIAGGRARAASPTTLAAQWQAAAMLPAPPAPPPEEEEEEEEGGGGPSSSSALTSSRPPRCREFIQASLKAALQKARRELETALAIEGGAGGGGGSGGSGGNGGGSGSPVGAIVVAGSNHAVAAALRDLGVQDIVEQLE